MRGEVFLFLVAAAGLIAQGASIEQVDAAAQKFGSPAAAQRAQAERRGKKWRLLEGMAMGPMTLGDLVGLELFWKQRKARP